ncbi:MAG: DUF3822 family protein [Bacteroides sp.]|nr:DUF3822 family protein [Bacteroides sp.]MCM1413014.1 DUF3822 family protein [Bacteroides sp.]MCM1471720.1 DUF3822 family protein [Bacteroides sp.]
MDSSRLDKDLISQPELWRLVLTVGRDALDVALLPPLSREEMILCSYPYGSTDAGLLSAIEDIVYDNPLLLSDFKRIDCIVDYVPQVLLPAALPDEAVAPAVDIASAAVTDADLCEPELFDTSDPECRVGVRQLRSVRDFLTRTFFNVRFDSRIASLVRHFNSLVDLPEGVRMFALTRGKQLTLIALQNHSVILANTFEFQSPVDAAFYILSAVRSLDIDPEHLMLMVSAPADASSQPSIASTLERFFPRVEPMPFPTLRYRASKATLRAPLELIIRPLCE